MSALKTCVSAARRAVPDDVAELIQLRHVLVNGSSAYYASSDPGEHRRWEECFGDWLTASLSSDLSHVAVVDAPDGRGPDGRGLAGCGIAIIDARPPGPGLIDGRCGWLQSIVTEPNWRGQGVGGSIVAFLMEWLALAHVGRVILHTTHHGQALYRRAGFMPCGEDAMVAVAAKPTTAAMTSI